jgi:hypothetical protein
MISLKDEVLDWFGGNIAKLESTKTKENEESPSNNYFTNG